MAVRFTTVVAAVLCTSGAAGAARRGSGGRAVRPALPRVTLSENLRGQVRDWAWNHDRPHAVVRTLQELTAAEPPAGALARGHAVVKTLTVRLERLARREGLPPEQVVVSVAELGHADGSSILVLDGRGRFRIYEREANAFADPRPELFQGEVRPMHSIGNFWSPETPHGAYDLRFSADDVLQHLGWLEPKLRQHGALDPFIWSARTGRPKNGPSADR